MEKVDAKEIELNVHGNGLRVKMGGVKKRKPILALTLSLLTPGLGEIYNGEFKRGISYLVGFYLVYLVFSFLLLTFHGMIFYLICWLQKK